MKWFKRKFLDIVKKEGLTPEQIYDCGKTGLNFKLTPKNTLASSSEKNAAGFKTLKERTAILVAANASGSHKLLLVMIGKAANPRAFKNLNMESLVHEGICSGNETVSKEKKSFYRRQFFYWIMHHNIRQKMNFRRMVSERYVYLQILLPLSSQWNKG